MIPRIPADCCVRVPQLDLLGAAFVAGGGRLSEAAIM
jgi:hypothetical protein